MEAGSLIAMPDSIIECLPPSQLRCTGRSEPTLFALGCVFIEGQYLLSCARLIRENGVDSMREE